MTHRNRTIAGIVAVVLVIVTIAVAQNFSQYPPVSPPQAFSWTGAIPVDPCGSSAIAKQSAVINISTATITALVPVVGTTTVYVCGFAFTINQQVTTAATLQFGYGTGVACVGSPAFSTGQFGAGGVIAGIPLLINQFTSSTIFQTPAANGLCATTAGPAGLTFQGVVTYVQR